MAERHDKSFLLLRTLMPCRRLPRSGDKMKIVASALFELGMRKSKFTVSQVMAILAAGLEEFCIGV